MKRSQLNLSIVPAAVVLLLIAPFVLYWSDLPNPMAIHWGPGGEPDGSAPPLVLVLGLVAVVIAIIVAIRRVVAETPGEAPSFVAGLYAIGALLVTVAWATVLANRNAATWDAASSVGWLDMLFAILVAVGAGTLGWLASGGSAAVVARDPGHAPTADVADPENAVWSGRGYGKLTTLIGIVIIVIGLVVWKIPGLVLVVVGLVALMFAVVRVTVSGGGVVVSLGWWGFPVWKIPFDAIERAEVEQVLPMAYGGWGYRLRPGVRATITRGGEAVRLRRHDRPDLVYTVDDAATGAGLINAIVGARR